MNPEAAALLALEPLITTTWPTLTALYRRPSLARQNWLNLLATGALTPPFATLSTGPSVPEAWGLDNACYRWTISVTLVVSLSEGAGDVASLVQAQLDLLRTALLTYTGGAFQCAGVLPTLDATASSPTNAALLSMQASCYAGELRAELLIGESP